MSKMQRTKGSSYERKIANIFKQWFPSSKRHLEYQSQEAELGVDVVAGPFMIQCKKWKNYAPISKIEEVRDGTHGIPLLVTAGDRKRDVVCMYLDDFQTLMNDVNVIHKEAA